jgi:hypothetical protein
VNHQYRLHIVVCAIALFILLAALIAGVGAANDLAGKKPSVELQLSKTTITLHCPPGARSISRSCPLSDDDRISLVAIASGLGKDTTYSYSVGAGQIVGEGSKVLWDLTGAGPGLYVVKVDVRDSRKRQATASVTVTIANCGDCIFLEPCMFTLVVTCYEKVQAGTPITCKLAARLPLDPDTDRQYTYEWSARTSDDHDLTATITKRGEYISIPTKDLAGKHVITTVEVKEIDPSCNRTASGISFVKP